MGETRNIIYEYLWKYNKIYEFIWYCNKIRGKINEETI